MPIIPRRYDQRSAEQQQVSDAIREGARTQRALQVGEQRGEQRRQLQELIGQQRAQEAQEDRALREKMQKQRLSTLLQGERKSAKRPKESEFKAAGFATRAQQAEDALGSMLQKGYDPTTFGQTALGMIPRLGGLGELIKGEIPGGQEQKQFDQAAKNFISAVLRKESGAAIGEEEYAREMQKYFPEPGDGPEVLAQKQQARAQAIQNLTAEAGPAAERVKRVKPRSEEDMRKRLQELRQKYGGIKILP